MDLQNKNTLTLYPGSPPNVDQSERFSHPEESPRIYEASHHPNDDLKIKKIQKTKIDEQQESAEICSPLIQKKKVVMTKERTVVSSLQKTSTNLKEDSLSKKGYSTEFKKDYIRCCYLEMRLTTACFQKGINYDLALGSAKC